MTSNSSSLLASQFHIASAARAGFVSNLWSKQAIFVYSQDKIDSLGIVAILLNGVFGFLLNCASSGVFLSSVWCHSQSFKEFGHIGSRL